jgi:MFS family permease
MTADDAASSIATASEPTVRRRASFHIVPLEEEAHQNVHHVDLGWRSWLVVFVTCFAVCAQVFVIAGAGQVITFIIRDVGDPALAGWIVQGPLLMQSVLSPIVGRLSDVLDRKYLSTVPPLIALAGAVVSAKATSMSHLVIGGILVGAALCTIGIVHSIPSEVLPLKYRAISNGMGVSSNDPTTCWLWLTVVEYSLLAALSEVCEYRFVQHL